MQGAKRDATKVQQTKGITDYLPSGAIWPIGYKENPTCMQARAEIMYRKLKLTKLISATIQEREKQPSLFMGISLLENKHALWGEYINV